MNQLSHSKKIIAVFCSIVMVLTSACTTTQALSGTRASMSSDIRPGKEITVFFKDGSSHAYKVKDTAPEALLVKSAGGIVETIPWSSIEHVEVRVAAPDATKGGFLMAGLLIVGAAALLASANSSDDYECTGLSWC